MARRWRVLSTSGGAGIYRSSDPVWIAAQVRGICKEGQSAQVDSRHDGWKIVFEMKEGGFDAQMFPANEESLAAKEQILELLELYGSV